VLIIAVAIMVALYLWSAMTTCVLSGFVPGATVASQLSGPGAHADFVGALIALPGVRLLERSADEALVSVMPVPMSMERGFGLFVVVRRYEDDGIVVLGRGRLPMAPGLEQALRQLERDVRMRISYGPRAGGAG